MTEVRTPAEGFSGTVAGVEFVDGVGETSNANALNYFRRHGYEIESAKAPAKAPAKKTAASKPSEK